MERMNGLRALGMEEDYEPGAVIFVGSSGPETHSLDSFSNPRTKWQQRQIWTRVFWVWSQDWSCLRRDFFFLLRAEPASM